MSSGIAHVQREVRRLFSSASDRFERLRENPITGAHWLSDVDPIRPQIRAARRALIARYEFASMAPPDAPPLPLSYDERERLKVGGLPHIVAWFARSSESFKYDFGIHPTFDSYAHGVLASPYAPCFITQDATLQQRFPAHQLKGLGPGLYWDPTLAPIGSAPRWQQRLFLNGPPPPLSQESHTVIHRQGANVPPWYAPNSKAFWQLDDDYIAHATKLASSKRLPRGWEVHKPHEVFNRRVGAHMLWLVKSDYGWLIERQEWFGDQELLAYILADFPVLGDTPAAAAWLAEAAHEGLPPEYQLHWIKLQ
jgi:hypothetical protein